MLTAYYDLATSPPTFNFFDFLLNAEMHRLQIGEERMRVRVIPGPADGFRRDQLPPFNAQERTRWLENIVLPMPVLLPSCGEPAKMFDPAEKITGPEYGRGAYLVGFRSNTTAAAKNLYPFRAPAGCSGHAFHPYVTITLRETGWWKSRQSDLVVWHQIARKISAMGYSVIVLRDAMRAAEPFHNFQIDPDASRNVCKRAALYAGAVMNLGIANGPLWFSWFMGAPVAIFDLVHDDEPCASRQSFEGAGLMLGEQLPNAKPGQRLVWEKATPKTVLNTFNQLVR